MQLNTNLAPAAAAARPRAAAAPAHDATVGSCDPPLSPLQKLGARIRAAASFSQAAQGRGSSVGPTSTSPASSSSSSSLSSSSSSSSSPDAEAGAGAASAEEGCGDEEDDDDLVRQDEEVDDDDENDGDDDEEGGDDDENEGDDDEDEDVEGDDDDDDEEGGDDDENEGDEDEDEDVEGDDDDELEPAFDADDRDDGDDGDSDGQGGSHGRKKRAARAWVPFAIFEKDDDEGEKVTSWDLKFYRRNKHPSPRDTPPLVSPPLTAQQSHGLEDLVAQKPLRRWQHVHPGLGVHDQPGHRGLSKEMQLQLCIGVPLRSPLRVRPRRKRDEPRGEPPPACFMLGNPC